MRMSSIGVLTAAVILAACAPLEQAPLVYSSKLTVGVDLSANTTEAPGTSVNIGLKSVDAAYVPVAVSKPIDQRDGSPKTIDIIPLQANYGQNNMDGTSPDLTDETKKRLEAYSLAVTAQSQAKATFLEAEINVQKVTRDRADFDVIQQRLKALTPETDEFDQKVKQYNDSLTDRFAKLRIVKDAAGQYDLKKARAAADELETHIGKWTARYNKELADATSALEQKNAQARETYAKVFKTLGTSKNDAFSVFGSFNSNGSGAPHTTSPSVSLIAGKVFSTGLASQNLTEAVRVEAESRNALATARSECVRAAFTALKSVDSSQAEKVMADVQKLCGP